MKKLKSITLLIISIFGAAMFQSCSNENSFEFIQSDSYTNKFLIDKKNGTVWKLEYIINSEDNSNKQMRWINLGTPILDAPNQGDTFIISH